MATTLCKNVSPNFSNKLDRPQICGTLDVTFKDLFFFFNYWPEITPENWSIITGLCTKWPGLFRQHQPTSEPVRFLF